MAAAIRQYYDLPNTQGPPNYPAYISASYTSTTLIGSCLVAIFCYSNDNGQQTGLGATDSQGNTWVRAIDIADTTSSGDERYAMLYCGSAAHALAPTDTVTIGYSGTDYNEIVLFEVTGVTSTPLLDCQGTFVQNIGASQNVTFNLNCGSGAQQAFVISGCMNSIGNGSAPFYPTAGTGLTFGNNWFYFGSISAYTASWAYGTFSAGSQAINWTSSVNGASSDNYVSFAMSLLVAPTPTGAAFPWVM